MKSIGAFEAKTHLSRLLEEVEGGEAVIITKNGRPVAELRPIHAHDPVGIDAAIRRMKELRARVRADPDGPTIHEMIEEGRM